MLPPLATGAMWFIADCIVSTYMFVYVRTCVATAHLVVALFFFVRQPLKVLEHIVNVLHKRV